jgi:zinc/manganese transport system substrate-binding protein
VRVARQRLSKLDKNKTQSYDSFLAVPPRSRAALILIALVLAASTAGCGSGGAAAGSSGRLRVVAAENFWGSIAAQLGGQRVQVHSIITNPSTDPHSYEPTPQDARSVAGAQMAIVNGIGYDEWAPRLLNASPAGERVVLNVGDVLGLRAGENPHQWYSPSAVRRIIAAIVAGYDRLAPADAGYFARQQQALETTGLAQYDRLRAAIRSRYAGVPVGYSESIFAPLGEDLGLKLLTPPSFAKAIAEGSEVSAQDKQTVDSQAQSRQIKVWVFNAQNLTPDVQRINEIARARHIPIATLTETLSPASSTFQQWQAAELEGLRRALAQATGR